MDKIEYRTKLEEMNEFIKRQDYVGALNIVTGIEWRRVRNIKTLCTVSEIYEANQRYLESKEVLLLAYNRSHVGRSVLYRLVEVCVKLREFDEAVDYYTEFVQAVPNDCNKYILKYKIYKGRGSSIEEQIGLLQEYKEKEYVEEWAYELARLYAKAGFVEKALDECDDLILWFNEGKFVYKAMELKLKYAPLTPSQRETYNRRFGIVENRKESLLLDEGLNLSKRVSVEIPMAEEIYTNNLIEDTEREIAKAVSLDREEAAKIKADRAVELEPHLFQEKLADNMRNLLAGFSKRTPENLDLDKKNVQEIEAVPVNEEESEIEHIEKQITGQISIEDVLSLIGGQKKENIELDEPIDISEDASDVEGIEVLDAPELGITVPNLRQDMDVSSPAIDIMKEDLQLESSIDDELSIIAMEKEKIAIKEEKRKLAEEKRQLEQERAELEERKRKEQEEQEEKRLQELAELEAKKIQEEFAAQRIKEQKELEEKLAEEKKLEEEVKKLAEQKQLEEQQKLEEAQKLEEQQKQEEAQKLEEKLKAEQKLEESRIEKNIIAAGITSNLEEVLMNQLQEMENEKADIVKEVSEDTFDVVENKIETEEPKSTEEIRTYTRGTYIRDVLTEEELVQFSYFAPVQGLHKQLAEAISYAGLRDLADKTSKTGNISIMGNSGMGKTVLAKSLLKVIFKERGIENPQIEHIDATELNRKDIANTIGKLEEVHALIIARAGLLNTDASEQLSKVMEFKTDGLLILIEDEKKNIQKLLEEQKEFGEKFTINVAVPIFTNDELVSFGKAYAKELDYHIDDMAILALYTKIGESETDAEPVSVADVKQLIDGAIKRAEKFGLGKFIRIILNKRYDRDDRIILYEKDFEF